MRWAAMTGGRGGAAMSGKGTTAIGFEKRNRQKVVSKTDRPGTDHNQVVYILHCGGCEHEYGANGSDIHARRCPKHDRGAPGL